MPHSLLATLKLTDEDGRVSLTNLAVYVVLVCLCYTVARSGTVEPTALGGLLTALGAYRLKAQQGDKREQRSADAEREDAANKVASLEAQLAEANKALALATRPTQRAAAAPALPAGLR